MSVYHWHKGELSDSYLFDLDESGRENFKRYLEQTANSPMTILVDVIEEEFRPDTIPHVFGADRKALIKRKQSRLYRDAVHLYTLDQGRESEGRKDDNLMFIALTNDEILRPWLGLLEEYKVPLKGILSVPLLLQSYIKTLPDISEHALIVSMQSISGLRQTFLKDGHLKISRLSKLPRFGSESYVPRINSEIEKIQRYLNSLRLIPNDIALDVYVLADKNTISELDAQQHDFPMVRRHNLDIAELLESSDQKMSQTVPFCDQLLIHHLLKTQVKNCYASAQEMRYLKTRSLKHMVNAASLILLMFGVVYSGLNLMNAFTSKHESNSFKNKGAFYQTRYDLARERLPKTPVEPDKIKVAVDVAAKLEEYKSTPYQMLTFLGKGLAQYPDIKLDDFDWSFSLDPDAGAAKSVTNNNLINVSVPLEQNNFKYYQISNINAHIDPFDGNYRDAIAQVNKFAETLRGFDNSHDVSIESFPLDISSNATLEGDAESVGKSALFSLRVVIGIQ